MAMALEDIVLDDEFRNVLPPLGEKQRAQLEASVTEEGCRDPLVVWLNHGILVDGYNRHEICTEHGVEFEIVEKKFKDRKAVKRWILTNQIGRRNLTAEQLLMVIGEVYKLDKGEVGGDGSNQHSEQLAQNEPIASKKSTAEKVGEQFGVSPAKVKRAEKFADAVNELPDEVAAPILAGQTNLTQAEVIALPSKPAKEQKAIVKAAQEKKPRKKKTEATPKEPDVLKDENGVVVPDHLKAIFALRPLFAAVLDKEGLQAVARNNSLKIQQTIREFPVKKIDDARKVIFEAFNDAMPRYVCRYCGGDRCNRCNDSGYRSRK